MDFYTWSLILCSEFRLTMKLRRFPSTILFQWRTLVPCVCDPRVLYKKLFSVLYCTVQKNEGGLRRVVGIGSMVLWLLRHRNFLHLVSVPFLNEPLRRVFILQRVWKVPYHPNTTKRTIVPSVRLSPTQKSLTPHVRHRIWSFYYNPLSLLGQGVLLLTVNEKEVDQEKISLTLDVLSRKLSPDTEEEIVSAAGVRGTSEVDRNYVVKSILMIRELIVNDTTFMTRFMNTHNI